MRALNSSGYKTRGCCSRRPARGLAVLCSAARDGERERERARAKEKERERRQRVGERDGHEGRESWSCSDAYVGRRRCAATAIKCFRVHNFLNIFITAAYLAGDKAWVRGGRAAVIDRAKSRRWATIKCSVVKLLMAAHLSRCDSHALPRTSQNIFSYIYIYISKRITARELYSV